MGKEIKISFIGAEQPLIFREHPKRWNYPQIEFEGGFAIIRLDENKSFAYPANVINDIEFTDSNP